MATISTKLLATAGSLAAFLVCAPAHAGPQGSGSFQVQATVPMACSINHNIQADAETGSEGLVTEGCNAPSGYMVSANYRPLGPTEHARLIYGATSLNLSAVGTQEVHREYGPRIQRISYRFDAVSLNAPLTLSLTIQPI